MMKFDTPDPAVAHVMEVAMQNAERSKDILLEVERDRTVERENTKVALEIILRIEQAIAGIPNFVESSQDERLKSFVQLFQSIWPENDNRGATTAFRLDALSLEMGNTVLRLAPMTQNASMGHDLKGNPVIRLGLMRLLNATSETLRLEQEKLCVVLVHEMEHLIAFGDEDLSGGEDEGQRFAYLSHPGEMRANAKMYAYLFNQHFPGDEFQREKLLSLKALSENGVGKKYYQHMWKSDVVAQKEVAQRMTQLTEWYLRHFHEAT